MPRRPIVVGALSLCTFATLLGAQRQTPSEPPLITMRVVNADSRAPIPHPMACVPGVTTHLGFIGDSLGWISFGGNLPKGKVKVRVVAPGISPVDTSVTWPPAKNAAPITLQARALSPSRVRPADPTCE
jgi:hypothetical protein